MTTAAIALCLIAVGFVAGVLVTAGVFWLIENDDRQRRASRVVEGGGR